MVGRVRFPAMRQGVSFAKLDLDAGERFVRLRNALGIETFGLNLLVLEPGQRGRIHRHERQEEAYVVLEGELTLEVEGEQVHTLAAGDAARVAPEVRRQLSNRSRERVALLAMGGADAHQGRDGVAYPSGNDREGHPPAEVPLPDDLP